MAASPQSSQIDFLSNLPDPIKQKILALVPLKETVRTSVLSTSWKHIWFGITSLIIHESEFGFKTLNELILLVYLIFFNHTNYLDKFEFVLCRQMDKFWFSIKEHLESWIKFLLRKHVRELVISLGYEPFEIPSLFFSLTKLEVIELRGCKINVPEYFNGFKLVRALKLEHVELIGIDIESLVSSCPVMTRFVFHPSYQSFDDLTIRSTSLLELDITAEFKELHLETPKLITLFVSLDAGNQDMSQIGSKYKNNISRIMCGLPEIQYLNICWISVQYLANGGVPKQLPVSLNHLTDLVVDIDCACTEHTDLVICLLQSAPNLKNLRIVLNSEELIDPCYPSYWEEAGSLIECQLNQLQTVTIGGEYLDLKCIVACINFLLRSAPVLEEVQIKKTEVESMQNPTEFLMELLELPRLSNKAIIK